MIGKKSNKSKRFPYIEVEGIQNQYLDAALLQCLDNESLVFTLRNEFKILKKAGILPAELKLNKFNQEELVRLVSPHLLENYNFYNYLVQKWDDIQIKTLKTFIKTDLSSFSLEQWDEEIRSLIQDKDIPVFAAVNLLRFYNNGELKELIQLIMRDFTVQFYYETGVQLNGYGVDWDKVDEKKVENVVESGELNLSEDIERKPEENLRLASSLIDLVANQITELGQYGEYKTLYQQEQEKTEKLTKEKENLSQEIKTKESQHQAFLKDNRTLSKNVDTLTTKLDQTKKELGKLGLSLGEVRKEKEELEKIKDNLERKVNILENEQNSIGEKIKEELKREYDLKILHMKDEYEKRLNILERELDNKEREQVEKNSEENSVEVERIIKELENVKNDLSVVEQERNELAEKVKAFNNSGENSKDNILGFSEDDIEDFVEFDNKPTRN
ncbi:coiled-coil domain-containing protein [Sutcliffiella deserti]|uniref:hypothetical protein n=1 Tax=Sutcliffiella deserti TaxID=2875501 RepID=UPI001CBCF01B|nr:hypothetical protein [Sutcliffiella deserti]